MKRKLSDEMGEAFASNKKPRLTGEECHCFTLPKDAWFEVFRALGDTSGIMLPMLSITCRHLNKLTDDYVEENGADYVEPDDWMRTLTEHNFVELFEISAALKKPVDSGTLDVAAREERKDIFDVAMRLNLFWCFCEDVVEKCARFGRLEFIKQALEHGCEFNKTRCFRSAIRSGSVECAKFFADKGGRLHFSEALLYAIRSRSMKMVKYVAGEDRRADLYRHEHYRQAAKLGCLNIMKYINLFVEAPPDICVAAAESGNLECLKYAYEKRKDWKGNELATCQAAMSGSLECLRFVRENGCEWHKKTIEYCSTGKNLDCLKYALENGCPTIPYNLAHVLYDGWYEGLELISKYEKRWTEAKASIAVRGGIKYLKMAVENGCIRDDETCAAAARYGDIECLKYAHENGMKMSKEVCFLAARAGSLHCLKYAHENGAFWDGEVYACAARAMSKECIAYAVENGCPAKWKKNNGIHWTKSRFGI